MIGSWWAGLTTARPPEQGVAKTPFMAATTATTGEYALATLQAELYTGAKATVEARAEPGGVTGRAKGWGSARSIELNGVFPGKPGRGGWLTGPAALFLCVGQK